jgi:hypothetical protein
MARAEYDRLEAATSLSQEHWEFRLFCLRHGVRGGHQWAIPRIMSEALSPGGSSTLDALSLNILPDTDISTLSPATNAPSWRDNAELR